jgi:hypothetical protein
MSVSVQLAPFVSQPGETPIPESGRSVVFDELAVTMSVPVPPIEKPSGGTACPTVTVSSVSPVIVGATATAVVAWADRDGDAFTTFAVSVISVPVVAFDGIPSATLAVTEPPLAARDPTSQLTELTTPEEDDAVHEP